MKGCHVLKDQLTRSSLERYFGILKGTRYTLAKLCKSISVDVSLTESDDVLWEGHEKALKTLRDLDGKHALESRKINPSLLDLKVELANRIFKDCTFCERKCRVNRTEKVGVCGVQDPQISSMFHHYGEEPELVPSYTIFFSGCNFHCQFCQNYDISQRITGIEVKTAELAKNLNQVNARNINWVGGSPTPNLNYILETLNYYQGDMPSVWNSNMYMSEEAMKLLDGTQDIFLTDLKYGDDNCATKLSKVKNYKAIVKRNHKLAKQQAELIVRHLVLPSHVKCCTKEVARFVSEELGTDIRFNLMFQYRPMHKAHIYDEINRVLSNDEISRAREIVWEAGLTNVVT
jgi:putative pyruvate formate lyase activating enzyme